MTGATKILCFLGFCLMFSSGTYGQRNGLQVIKEWTHLTWSYDTDAEEQQAIIDGEFIVGNGVPVDMDAHYGDDGFAKIFITAPRLKNGIPASLNTISEGSDNPKLTPYPSWDWHRNSSCCPTDRLVSVYRTQIDDCGRLWVLDTGKIGSNQICNAQVIAFEPSTDKVLYRYEIPSDQLHKVSRLVTLIVEVLDPLGSCLDTFVYAADVSSFGLIVIDTQNDDSWRIENKLFYPTPEFGTFNVAGESFELMSGILGMALSPYKSGEDRLLYFHALASNTENNVNTSVLQNGNLFINNTNAVPGQFKEFNGTRPSQVPAEAIDRNGIMYYGQTHEITMNCWNTKTEFNERNFGVIGNNSVTLQFASGVKIINNSTLAQELWVLTNRYQKVVTGSMNIADTNFRILKAATDDLLQGNKCNNPREAPVIQTGSSNSNSLIPRLQQILSSIFSNHIKRPAL